MQKLDKIVMHIYEEFLYGDPASPERTIISFIDENDSTVCRMEFYADKECAYIYDSVLRYATKAGIKSNFTSNVNNHYY